MANKKAKPSRASMKNEMKMKLLVVLPSFQNDVSEIRKEFGIPEGGFGKNDKAYSGWYHKKFYEEPDKIQDSKPYKDEELGLKTARWERKINPNEYKNRKWKLLDRVPISALNHRLDSLRKKYRLPFNFISAARGGIRWYIERGEVLTPGNNWMIILDQDTRKETARWLSIQTFAPLSKEEGRDSLRMLKGVQAHYFPASINIPLRERKKFERDLLLVNELSVKRTGHPVRKKHLTNYLAILEKSGGMTPSAARLHKRDIQIGYDQPTSKEIGKTVGANNLAVRKALQRLNRLSNKLFGVGFS